MCCPNIFFCLFFAKGFNNFILRQGWDFLSEKNKSFRWRKTEYVSIYLSSVTKISCRFFRPAMTSFDKIRQGKKGIKANSWHTYFISQNINSYSLLYPVRLRFSLAYEAIVAASFLAPTTFLISLRWLSCLSASWIDSNWLSSAWKRRWRTAGTRSC